MAILTRVLHDSPVHIVLSTIHVKDALRQVPVDPAGATIFGCVVGDLAVVATFACSLVGVRE